MKFLWTTLLVSNMEASLKFFQDIVGLPVARRFATPDGSAYAFLGEGETKLELIAPPTPPPLAYGRELSIGFEAESLSDKLAFVQGKGYAAEGPYAPNPHVSFFFVKGPDGIRVQFVENH